MVNLVELINVTACATPLYVTVALLAKFDPFNVRVRDSEPTVADVGDRLLSVGVSNGEFFDLAPLMLTALRAIVMRSAKR
jgi:hypothetical protein